MITHIYNEEQLHKKYGYLMDMEHGKDTELLIDILKETGLCVGKIGCLFFVNE